MTTAPFDFSIPRPARLSLNALAPRPICSAWVQEFCVMLLLLVSCGAGWTAPIGADRIAELPEDIRPAWEAYWDQSQQLRAQDEMLIQNELRQLGEGAKWQPAPTGRMVSGRSWRLPDWVGSEEARVVVTNLASFQTPAGGWSKNVAIGMTNRQPGMGFGESRAHYRGTFDNNATTSPLRLLGRIAMAQDDALAKESFLKGLNYIFTAQYPNGGWPQVYPLEGGYHDNVTYNDGAMINILEFLHEVADGEYAFINQSVRTQARQAIARGEEFILASQVIQNGVETVWCAQHDPITLKPANARSYEWASLSGGESAGITMYLMNSEPQSEAVRVAVEAAHEWFTENAIYGKVFRMRQLQLIDQEGAGPLWARFYELDTGRPMFVERNADHAVYSLAELPMASNGYAWYTDAGKTVLERYSIWKAGAQPVSPNP